MTMMKNKKTHTTSASDEFQSLLDTFVEDRSCNAVAVDCTVEPERVPCLYKGKVYAVPAPASGAEQVEAFGAFFSFGIQSATLEEGSIRLFLPDSAETCPELVLSMDVIVSIRPKYADF